MSRDVRDRPPSYDDDERERSKDPKTRQDIPREIRIEIKKSRRRRSGSHEHSNNDKLPKVSSVSQNYEYVNPAFVGSTNSVNNTRQTRVLLQPPIDTVYREQYCICSRWPFAKKALAIGVGMFLGAAAVGITIFMVFYYLDQAPVDVGFF